MHEFKAIQNDIRAIKMKKFSFEDVAPVVDGLNATGDNKVILWYVRTLCIILKFPKIQNISVPWIILLTSSGVIARPPSLR